MSSEKPTYGMTQCEDKGCHTAQRAEIQHLVPQFAAHILNVGYVYDCSGWAIEYTIRTRSIAKLLNRIFFNKLQAFLVQQYVVVAGGKK